MTLKHAKPDAPGGQPETHYIGHMNDCSVHSATLWLIVVGRLLCPEVSRTGGWLLHQ